MYLRTRDLFQLIAFLLAFATVTDGANAQQMTREERAAHVLSRLTFGAGPGDLDRVLRMGAERWIEEQLAPRASSDEIIARELANFALWRGERADLARQQQGSFLIAFEVMPRAMGMARSAPPDSATVARAVDSVSRIVNQALMGPVLRADVSETQLLEVLTDFWQNHFSVFGNKTPTRATLMAWDRDIIRPRALGSFRELLGAVAHSPAMMFFLDNQLSGAEPDRMNKRERDSLIATGIRHKRASQTGLNENYARELLELHTVGVDGGYTQDDVLNVARAFTGWSVSPGTRNDSGQRTFLFQDWKHDAEEKTVLGRKLAAGRAEEDGEEVLDILASHPSAARFISRKLALRFVSDSPSTALVDSAAATFTRTKGDIREVLRTILRSEEFFSRAALRSKVKSPQEFVFSIRRALASPRDTVQAIPALLTQLGQPIFGRMTPEGWPEAGASWLTVEAMFRRIDLAERISRDEFPAIPLSGSPLWNVLRGAPFDLQVGIVVNSFLGGTVSPETQAILARARPEANATPEAREVSARELVMLTIGSPEFQRR